MIPKSYRRDGDQSQTSHPLFTFLKLNARKKARKSRFLLYLHDLITAGGYMYSEKCVQPPYFPMSFFKKNDSTLNIAGNVFLNVHFQRLLVQQTLAFC